jgi:HAD superfamily hydrolase (TIGR01456 family)
MASRYMSKAFRRTPFRAFLQTASPSERSVGYVFDIDGVLLRGAKVLPAALSAMRLLHDSTSGSYRVPVVFLTNGGGHTEAKRAEKLSDLLSVPVSPSQVILSHSPMRSYASSVVRGRSVLTVGGPDCPKVARSYGFSNVMDIARYGQATPESTPFAAYENAIPLTKVEREAAQLPVGVVLVMSDSDGFQRDIQLIVDAVEEDPAVRPEDVTVIFANPDLTFPNEHVRPRLAGGTLRIALDAILAAHTGARRTRYRAVQLGKPFPANYEKAEDALLAQKGQPAGASVSDVFDAVYMVGDNPASDVRGARNRGRPWHSLLVRSGNFRGGGNCDVDPADTVVADVHEAVSSTLTL